MSSKNLLLPQDKIQEILGKYPDKKSALVPLLILAQEFGPGWVQKEALEAISILLDMSAIHVLEVASFYSMIRLTPTGTYHIQVCRTLPCWLKGAEAIKNTCEQYLSLKVDQSNKMFTLSEVECLGACIHAPVLQIGDRYFEYMTEESVKDLLNECAQSVSKNIPKP